MQGSFSWHDVIYPFQPKNDIRGFGAHAESSHRAAPRPRHRDRQRHRITRNAGYAFVREFLRKESLDAIFSVTVSESGASHLFGRPRKWRAQEFPDLDLTVRGAISIARRLQDPLAELVKPRSEIDRRRAVSAHRCRSAAVAEIGSKA